MSKPYSVTVQIISESNGVVNQEVVLKEYAATEEELVTKNHAIADTVIFALNDLMKQLSAEVLKGKGKG